MESSNALTAIILAFQSIPLAAGSYGGVTGLDSVARGVCALVDQTTGPLLLYGLVNLCYPDLCIPCIKPAFHLKWMGFYGSRVHICYPGLHFSSFDLKLRMARIGFIHTKGYETDIEGASASFRANWLDINNTVTRAGKFLVRESSGGRKTLEQLEEGFNQREGVVPFAPNSNHWIYPYLLGKQPREAGQMVALSRECLIQTTALVVARFAILLACSMMVTLFHIFVVLFLFEDTLTKIFLIIGDIGRWILVVGQLASVMTYSLDYKGVCSWASPKTYGTRWNKREHIQCRNLVLHYIGKMYPAGVVFRLAAWLWPKVTARTGGRWKDVLGEDEVFSSFHCFSENDLADNKSTLLRLFVAEKAPGESSIDFRDSYHIDFKVPTELIQSGFDSRLQPNPTQQKYNFRVMGPFCVCNILAPFVLIWRDGQSSNPTLTLIISSLFQIVTLVFNYKDIDNQSINCRFQNIPQPLIPGSPYIVPPSPFRKRRTGGSTGTRWSHVHHPNDFSNPTIGVCGTSTATVGPSVVGAAMIALEEQDVTEGVTDRKGKSRVAVQDC
ncbi:hypothetical protein F5876DRAFT_65715 [Lentinula aff. lateritia]|uniref:Uncharacterized protein n=1 Tax=Lentinula aff. lateritia TaxID=2804960 RepID=A0ACC1TZY9_9AGAR|nr:hypothetical protein F5876DRAFT_65715 [Lentinula aff. lateritia]